MLPQAPFQVATSDNSLLISPNSHSPCELPWSTPHSSSVLLSLFLLLLFLFEDWLFSSSFDIVKCSFQKLASFRSTEIPVLFSCVCFKCLHASAYPWVNVHFWLIIYAHRLVTQSKNGFWWCTYFLEVRFKFWWSLTYFFAFLALMSLVSNLWKIIA